MTTIAVSRAAEQWIADVRALLADLPTTERDELLEDLDALVVDVEADGESVVQRLGSPAAYTAELRAAAGLPPAGQPQSGLLVRGRQLLGHPGVRWTRLFLADLRPGWWVLRGALVGWAVAYAARGYSSVRIRDLPFPPVHGRRWAGALILLVAVGASVAAGRRWRPRGPLLRALVVLVDAVVLGVALQQLSGLRGGTYYFNSYPQAAPVSSDTLTGPDGIVYNALPYDKHGKLLKDVRLYDQSGNPLRVRVGQDLCGRQLQRLVPLNADGSPIDNLFPQKQLVVDPLTGAAVAAALPSLSVPALPSAGPAGATATPPASGPATAVTPAPPVCP